MFSHCYITTDIFCFTDFWPESLWISFQTRFYGSITMIFVFQIIETIHAVAHVAKFPIGEAIAVQFQAL